MPKGGDADRLENAWSEDAGDSLSGEELDMLAVYLRSVRMRSVEIASEAERRDPSGGGETVEGDPAQDALVEAHLGLVVRIAKRYIRYGYPVEDLIQEGNLGLLAAARRFEPARGIRFENYAAGWIRQAVCRALSIRSRTIRIPLDVLLLRRQAERVLAELEQEAGERGSRAGRRERQTEEECARRLGVPLERLKATLRSTPDVISLDGPVAALAAILEDASAKNPFESAALLEQCALLRAGLEAMPGRLRLVMTRYYGLDGREPASFAALGRELSLSRERVRQLHNRGVASLREIPGLGELVVFGSRISP